jgi:hypothetical protein
MPYSITDRPSLLIALHAQPKERDGGCRPWEERILAVELYKQSTSVFQRLQKCISKMINFA